MANLGESIDVDTIEIDNNYEPLPAGEYMAQVADSDVVETKAGTGLILKLTFEVMDGPSAGRKVWLNLNYKNPNATAQRIAHEQIKQICDAVGFAGHLTDSEVLHYKPLRVRLTVKQDPEYGPRNEMKKFSAMAGGAPPPGKAQGEASSPRRAQTGGTAATSRPGTAGGRPWGNRAA
ncbi:DUF669 domain-containing protein [Methylobacterium indicum]|uniref:DUF669 domain-containing protein n=1 Tax=Methylobacterium indicum TaxID=1775910 RepID=A0A8H9C837_9HYPH|nr:DUF669 domain-containing protein [Methylobacterium indicum]BCM86867.1 hypothetical protein mvi_53280 [Methylobacterium indicum]